MASPDAVTAPPPRRPWWKRKRTWAAAVALLVVAAPTAYLLGTGPTLYAVLRSWIPTTVYLDAYGPLWRLIDQTPYDDPIVAYERWWRAKAEAASD